MISNVTCVYIYFVVLPLFLKDERHSVALGRVAIAIGRADGNVQWNRCNHCGKQMMNLIHCRLQSPLMGKKERKNGVRPLLKLKIP